MGRNVSPTGSTDRPGLLGGPKRLGPKWKKAEVTWAEMEKGLSDLEIFRSFSRSMHICRAIVFKLMIINRENSQIDKRRKFPYPTGPRFKKIHSKILGHMKIFRLIVNGATRNAQCATDNLSVILWGLWKAM